MVAGCVAICVGLSVAFLPTIIALARRVWGKGVIFGLNFIGLICFVLSVPMSVATVFMLAQESVDKAAEKVGSVGLILLAIAVVQWVLTFFVTLVPNPNSVIQNLLRAARDQGEPDEGPKRQDAVVTREEVTAKDC